MQFKTANIFGFNFIAAEMDEVVRDIMLNAERDFDKRPQFMITPNAYTIVHYLERKHKQVYDHYRQSQYILPDGIPVVWLSKIVGKTKLPNRLTGSDLFPLVWNSIKTKGYHVSLVLPKEFMADLFKKDYPNSDTHIPLFFDENDDTYIEQFAEEVANGIIKNRSSFLFLGLNFPKQEKLGIQVAKKLQAKGYDKGVLILLLGASFEFYFNLKKRAPAFFRKTGLEWLHRFITEPKRLWKRYTVDIARFFWISFKELLSPSYKK